MPNFFNATQIVKYKGVVLWHNTSSLILEPKKGNTEVLPYVYHITCIAIANGIIANTRYTTIL